MLGKIIALVGPSGVGKNFAKQAIKDQFPGLSELTVFTTRSRRSSDGSDRGTDISVDDFLKMQKEGKIIAVHQPFGPDSDWYGFFKEQISKLLENQKQILTEIDPDNIALFKKLYGSRVFTIALIAARKYLEHNLKSRGSEKDIDRDIRLNKAVDEIKMTEKLKKTELIEKIIEVNWDNRNKLAELVVNEVAQEINFPIEWKNELKLK